MKCPVCNENEVTPTKDGGIPDCFPCQAAIYEAVNFDDNLDMDSYNPRINWIDEDEEVDDLD